MDFDFVIVGAGAAGSVLATRLTEDPRTRVLVLEAGGSDIHPLVHIPAGFIHLLGNSRLGWGYETEPETGAGNRTIRIPRGKLLGGSSSINGLWQAWGLPSDYDAWEDAGCPGWGFSTMRRYLRKQEAYAADTSGIRGHDGPIAVSDFTEHHPLTKAFLRAGAEIQLPTVRDLNADPREGLSLVQQTRRGRFRTSAYRSYLAPARKRNNLRIITNALATGLEMSDGRVTGVTFRRGSSSVSVSAKREVILAAGAFNSPHLLLLSGIGPAEQLRNVGIGVRHNLPGVGENLHDHYIARVVRAVRGSSLNEESRGLRLMAAIARYVVRGRGILTYSPANGTGFLRSTPSAREPDLQLAFSPASYSPTRAGALDDTPAMTCGVWQMRPSSRGTLRLRSRDPGERPAVSIGYLQTELDQAAIVSGLRWCRRILGAPALDGLAGAERFPGEDLQNDDELLNYARQTGSTVYHPVGTCRMGNDGMAVVDPTLRVRGVGGLRIADASVMPRITSSNTHAPTVAIAERAAAIIASG
jgi:choline dehydrogenase